MPLSTYLIIIFRYVFVRTVHIISSMKILTVLRASSVARRIHVLSIYFFFPSLFAELEGEERKTKSDANTYYRDMLMMQIDAAEIKKKM